jgi:hypothetical protein
MYVTASLPYAVLYVAGLIPVMSNIFLPLMSAFILGIPERNGLLSACSWFSFYFYPTKSQCQICESSQSVIAVPSWCGIQ